MALNPQNEEKQILSNQPLEIIRFITKFLPLRSYEALSCSNKYFKKILYFNRRAPLTKIQVSVMNKLANLIVQKDNTYKKLVIERRLRPTTLFALTHLVTTRNKKFLIVTKASEMDKWAKTYIKLTSRNYIIIEPYVIESFGRTYNKDLHEDILIQRLAGKKIVIIYHQMFRGSDFARFIYQYNWDAVLFDNLDIVTARNWYGVNMKYIKLSSRPKNTNYYSSDPELEPKHSLIKTTQILNLAALNETEGSNLIARRIESIIQGRINGRETNQRTVVVGHLHPDVFKILNTLPHKILSPTFLWPSVFKYLRTKKRQNALIKGDLYFNPTLETYLSNKNSTSIFKISWDIEELSAFIKHADYVIYINREVEPSDRHIHYIIERMKKLHTRTKTAHLTHIIIQDKYTIKRITYCYKQLAWNIISYFGINRLVNEFATQNLYLSYANAIDMYLAKNIIRVPSIKYISSKNSILDAKYLVDILIDISKLSKMDCPELYLYEMLIFWNMTQIEQNIIVSGRKIRFKNKRKNMDNFRMWLFGNNDPNPKYKRNESAAKRIKLS